MDPIFKYHPCETRQHSHMCVVHEHGKEKQITAAFLHLSSPVCCYLQPPLFSPDYHSKESVELIFHFPFIFDNTETNEGNNELIFFIANDTMLLNHSSLFSQL